MDNNDIDSGSGLISSQSNNDIIDRDVMSFSKVENNLANEELRKVLEIKEQQAAEKELEN